MSSVIGGGAVLLVGGVIFLILIIIILWYIFLPLILGVGIYYLYNKHFKKIQLEKEMNERRKILEQERISAQQQKEKQRKQEEEERQERELRQQRRRENQRQQEEKEKQERVNFKLKRFNLSENEAELIFGKLWRKRLAKPDSDFASQEMNRLWNRLIDDESLYYKFSEVMEKIFDLWEYYGRLYGEQQGCDDIIMENWKESLENVKQLWQQGKHLLHSRNHYHKSNADNFSDSDDYYQILGVSRKATHQEIKIEYKKLILKYHPDRNSLNGAEEYCRKINEAYEILSDSKKREIYDKHGFIYE